ncbi:MAG TPA: acetate/propionate family kinase [Opitutaceae bacterium]|nr:acetate/propionate family kinase [Opitutaceae bacterium]
MSTDSKPREAREAEPAVLALNAGSSSLKYALFFAGSAPERALAGEIDRVRDRDGTGYRQEIDFILGRIAEIGGLEGLAVAGHRVLHGGSRHRAPRRLDAGLMAELRRLTPLAPEHLPEQIALIEALERRLPHLPQVACFDTAFHHHLPREARFLPLPRRYAAAGVQRYGFHGLAYEHLMEELSRLGEPAAASGRVILAHLGNGASLAAVRAGRCIDTTMGFTPAAGLMMGRRSGDLDPGLVAYLARTEDMTAERFDRLVNHESGLLGISETSSDMRALLKAEATDPRAADAVAMFCYQVRKGIGAFAAVLGGLDLLVFSGGIGEHSAPVRTRICAELGFLGLGLDADANTAGAGLISDSNSRVRVHALPADEELTIARSACRLLGLGRPTSSHGNLPCRPASP